MTPPSIADARTNEELVIAETRPRGERQVSVLRLVLMALRAVSVPLTVLVTGEAVTLAPIRGVAIGAYWVFAIGTFLRAGRAEKVTVYELKDRIAHS